MFYLHMLMGRTQKYKALDLKSNDFSFCVELPIKAKFKNFILVKYSIV